MSIKSEGECTITLTRLGKLEAIEKDFKNLLNAKEEEIRKLYSKKEEYLTKHCKERIELNIEKFMKKSLFQFIKEKYFTKKMEFIG
jgi:hypothetical protein